MNILHWSDLVQKLLHLKHSISQDCDIFETFPILTLFSMISCQLIDLNELDGRVHLQMCR